MTEQSLEKESKTSSSIWARIVLIIISYFILAGIFQFVGGLIMNVPITNLTALKNMSINQLLILELCSFTALVIVMFRFRKFIDKKTILSMGFSFKNRIKDIIAGFIIALFIIGGGSLILYVLDYINFSNTQMDLQTLLLSLFLFIIVSLNEEILFRGYILNNLLTSMNKYLALTISALIFMLMHAFNFNLSVIAFLNLFLAGLLLGSTYIFTKNLWFPLSLHLFWNFLQGPILGYSISGRKIDSLFSLEFIGANYINGGGFGFEGSILCSFLTFIFVLLILLYYKRTNLNVELRKLDYI
ncbi:MAG: CPBP family intramembrane glutamic endopeptidase [Candidatus Saccharimonadaceae bacterium]